MKFVRKQKVRMKIHCFRAQLMGCILIQNYLAILEVRQI